MPIGKAKVVREGRDLSIITYGAMVWTALEAAETLAAEGCSVEVVDLRTLMPLDRETICASVRKTSKALLLHEDTRTGGMAGELAATITENVFEYLDGPIVRVTAPDTPVPYQPSAGGGLPAQCGKGGRESSLAVSLLSWRWPPLVSAADYRAGAAASGSARALVLEDARGNRAVFTQTEFRITQALADFVAARLLVALRTGARRTALALERNRRPARAARGSGDGDHRRGQCTGSRLRSAMGIARFRCRRANDAWETLSPDGALSSAGCTDGVAVTGGIRAAFQMVEPTHGLQKRGETVRSFPVQAIALGKQVTILALSGEAALPEGVNPRGLIFAPFSNEAAAAPQRDARVRAAVQRVLARVK